MERNNPCWCGSGQKWKKCHWPQLGKTDDQALAQQYLKQFGIILKTPIQIAGIRKAGHLAAQILDKVCAIAKAGITTNELNTYAEKLHRQAGAIPAPLGYGDPPYKKSICTSLNDVICHGIPDDIPLKEGDILNIDITAILDGFYGDCSKMVTIGAISAEKKNVIEVSYACLMRAIGVVKPGAKLYEIGQAIEEYATAHHCSVVNQFVGHGVGIDFHEPPQIPHNYNHIHIPLVPGMIFTIEPMINAGVREAIIDPHDHWTARTADGRASAQCEHTILVTQTGAEILTPWSV